MSRFPGLTYYLNAMFCGDCLTFTLCYVFVVLGIMHIVQCFYAPHETIKAISIFFVVLTGIVTCLMAVVSLEQVVRLIHRTARLKTMVFLYISTVFLYALLYMFFELMDPGKFNGINPNQHKGVLRLVKMYTDFLYFSSIGQASVGFGDISSTTDYGRIIVLTQAMLSVVYLSILFSNWIS